MKPRTKLFIYLISAVLLVAAAHVLGTRNWLHPSLESAAQKFQQKLNDKETLLETNLNELIKDTDNDNPYNEFRGIDFVKLFAEEGMLFMIYEDDELKFWSDNSVPLIDELTPRRNYDEQLQQLGNGWYLSKTQKVENKTYVGLLLIKNAYPFENKYLKNRFNTCLNAEEELEISSEQVKGNPEISAKDGTYLFSVIWSDQYPHIHITSIISILFFFAGAIFFLLFIYQVTASLTVAGYILFPASLLIVRGLMLLFQYPATLYSLPLFDPAYHASSVLFPSLGDFLLNILTTLGIVFYITNRISKIKYNDGKNYLTIVSASLALLLAIGIHFPVSFLLERLIVDSDIDFTINNLFTLNYFSYAGLFITFLLLLSWFLVLNKVIELIAANSKKEKLISYICAILLFSISAVVLGRADWQSMGITALISGAMLLISHREKTSRSVFSSSALILGFSVYAAYSLASFHKIKVESNLPLFAEKLASEQDPVAEYIYPEVAEEVENDRQIKNFITLLPQRQDEFFARLEQKFLNDYLQKYDVRISVFDKNDSLIATDSKQERSMEFYKTLEKESTPVTGRGLVYCYEKNEDINYLGKLIFANARDTLQAHTVFIEFEEKILKNELGFPELLLDKNVNEDKNLDDYSFAVYHSGALVSAYGDFNYSKDEPSVQLHTENFEFRSSGNWRHLFYKSNSQNLILLSRPQLTGFQKLTGVSFLFLLYSVFTLLLLGAARLFYKRKKENANFRNRLNISIISILTVFLLFIGFATIYYVGNEYSNKNVQAIREKIHSVLTDLENKSGRRSNFYEDRNQLGYTLNRLSKIFFTDINIYDTSGELMVSTRPRVFDMGLVSEKMNADALFSMLVQKKTMFVHNEHIGKLSYLSAYAPLTNSSGETVAYLNLPYFAKQNGLQKEILILLSALVNIYVLLIIIAVAIALVISKKITEPFEVIGENIQQVKLGQENKPIEWNSDDEIGRLVIEYNRMIRKLGESAETLAKSERESAWREMARQVAHEIKNPLTPMKLSVQHLQRSYKEQTPGWDKNIERMTRTMIEQIDTLAHIASEFSNFAKMPRANNEKINISDVIEGVVELYKDTENCRVEFVAGNRELYVFADREQLQRVFNNLVKNATQSIPEGREGVVKISLEQQENMVFIKVADNGTGIDDEMMDKIFTPNFTTKSTGMGLGLAMVKSIIENNGGSIWFETKEDMGTVFFVSIPLFKD